MSDIADILSKPAGEFGNDPEIEMAWVMKATQHMEVYFNLICSADPSLLKLTKYDNEIYEKFKNDFPDLKVDILTEKALKSPEAKEKWRNYCESFQHIEDFNFGTILRLDSSGEYNDGNTIFVPRVQFYAIEIARNREGLNNQLRHLYPNKVTLQTDKQNILASTITSIEYYTYRKKIQAKVRTERWSNQNGSLYFTLHKQKNNLDLKVNLEELAKELLKESQNWVIPLEKCIPYDALNYIKLNMSLDRKATLIGCLQVVQKMKEKYGRIDIGLNKNAMVLPLCNERCELRQRKLSVLLCKLLKCQGYVERLRQSNPFREDTLN